LNILERLRADLGPALREGRSIEVSMIRTLIAAIENAGAVDATLSSDPKIGLHHDQPRRELGDEDITAILDREWSEVSAAIDDYRRLGMTDEVTDLGLKREVIDRYRLPETRDNRASATRETSPSLALEVTDDPVGAILTGGRSTRMGRDKASVIVEGTTMLGRVASALSRVTDRVVLLGSDREEWECWPDSVHAQGPLAGIATALRRSDRPRVLAVAVDHAFVRHETLQQLALTESGLPVVPVDESGVRQVTCALYPVSIVDEALEEAAAGGSIQTLLDRVSFRPVTPDEWKSWGEDGRSWYSIDSEEALSRAVSLFAD
jgi:molybdopterin-guanine dinucleotide biosynthesis protein A/uncharacterized protein YqeY